MPALLSFCWILLGAHFFTPPTATPPAASNSVTLRVYVDNIQEAVGTLWVGVYESEEDFLDREKARLVYARVTMKGQLYLEIPDMQQGKEYALGLFHDKNDNGEFDLNWLGLPAEPWAFSGQPKTRLRLPYFREVSFRFLGEHPEQVVSLRKW